jgi:hypothetical protein
MVLQNTGDAPLSVASVTLGGDNPADFTIVTDGWSGQRLMPGQVATLNLRFTPTAAGDRHAVLTVVDDAPGGSHTVTLAGAGTAPVVSLDASSVSFPDQLVGTTSAEETVTLTNTGTAPLALVSVAVIGANASDFAVALDPGSTTLAPGQSAPIHLRFRPNAAGPRAAGLVIVDTAAGSPHGVLLSGNGTAPSVTFGISRLNSPSTIAFGNQALGRSSDTQTLTLANSGTASLTITSISLTGANAGDYQIVSDSGPTSLAPGASRTLTLRFTPLALGSRAASLAIQDNAGGGTQTVGLTGAGVLPVVGTKGLILPISAELIATVDGVAAPSGKPVIVAVGQTVTLKLRVKFKDGAVADVTTDPISQYAATPKQGKYTAPGAWTAQAADAGRTTTLTGSWTLPKSRQRLVGAVKVTVKAVRKTRQ